jgi:hypothetical protein
MEKEEEEILATLAAERAELTRLKVANRLKFEVPPLRLVHTASVATEAAGETAETREAVATAEQENPTELERVKQQIQDAEREAEQVEKELRDAELATEQARAERHGAPEQDGSDRTPAETPAAPEEVVEVSPKMLSQEIVDRLDDAHRLLDAGDYRGSLTGFHRLVQEFRPYYATGCAARATTSSTCCAVSARSTSSSRTPRRRSSTRARPFRSSVTSTRPRACMTASRP